MGKPVISLKCDKRDCEGVLRENLLAHAQEHEPPIERDTAGWYFINCPACGAPYRLPSNGAHFLHTFLRHSSVARLALSD